MSGHGVRLSNRRTTFGTQTGPLLSNHRTTQAQGQAPMRLARAHRFWNTVVRPRLSQEGKMPAPKLVSSTKVHQNESCEDGDTTRDSRPCKDLQTIKPGDGRTLRT